MSLVLDASLTLSWYFANERTPEANDILDQVTAQGAHVPGVWRLEAANGLPMSVCRGHVDAAFRDQALTELAQLPIAIDAETGTYAWTTTLQLADRFRLTVHDAAYLELAQRKHVPLATLDKELRMAGVALGVRLFGAME